MEQEIFYNQKKKDITIIGAAIIDILAGPVTPDVFCTGSWPVDTVKLSFGGDALNEAAVLAKFGKNVELVSKVGLDDAGERVLDYMERLGLPTDSIVIEDGLATSMNLVLVDGCGERCFLTNPAGSLRRLTLQDVEKYLDGAADLVSFAGMFVSPQLDIPAMEQLFRTITQKPGRTLAVNSKKAKNGERLEDLSGLLPYIDYIFPNEAEIALLTGQTDPAVNAGLLVQEGVSCAVVKCAGNGCLIRTADETFLIPAYPVETVIDTTGAGDCFAAGFLWALSEGMKLEDCGKFACAAASCAVEKMGAAEGICSLEEPLRRFACAET